MKNEKFKNELLKILETQKEYLKKEQIKEAYSLIEDFKDNTLFNLMKEEEHMVMVDLIWERIAIEIKNNVFSFACDSSNRTSSVLKKNIWVITHCVSKEVEYRDKVKKVREREEDFYKYLKKQYKNYGIGSTLVYMEIEQRKLVDAFIDNFTSETFLDKINYKDKEEVAKFTIEWAILYYAEDNSNRLRKPTMKLSQKIKSDRKQINKFSKFIKSHLVDIDIPTENLTLFDYMIDDNSIFDNHKYLLNMYKMLEKLDSDLKDKTFKIFNKYVYYLNGSEHTKKELEKYLIKIAKKNKLKYSDDIRDILASIKTNNR